MANDDAARRAAITTNVASPDMLTLICARGRSADRLSRILVRRRRFRVHNQSSVGDRKESEVRLGHRGIYERSATVER